MDVNKCCHHNFAFTRKHIYRCFINTLTHTPVLAIRTYHCVHTIPVNFVKAHLKWTSFDDRVSIKNTPLNPQLFL